MMDLTEDKITSARLGFNALYKISELLDTGLDRETLVYCTRLFQDGVHPEGLAEITHDMKKQVEACNAKQEEKNLHGEDTKEGLIIKKEKNLYGEDTKEGLISDHRSVDGKKS